MGSPRFSIARSLAGIALLGVGIAALRASSPLWRIPSSHSLSGA